MRYGEEEGWAGSEQQLRLLRLLTAGSRERRDTHTAVFAGGCSRSHGRHDPRRPTGWSLSRGHALPQQPPLVQGQHLSCCPAKGTGFLCTADSATRPSGSETVEKTRVRLSLSYRGALRSFTAVKGGDPWKSPPGCQDAGGQEAFAKTTALGRRSSVDLTAQHARLCWPRAFRSVGD